MVYFKGGVGSGVQKRVKSKGVEVVFKVYKGFVGVVDLKILKVKYVIVKEIAMISDKEWAF